MKKITVLALCAIAFIGCESTKKNADKTQHGYIESSSFKEYIKKIEDKDATIYSTKRMFNLIGEADFLYHNNYDFYAIYLYSYYEDTFKVYVIKSQDEITSSSIKIFNDDTYLYHIGKKTDSQNTKAYLYNTKTQILNLKGKGEIQNDIISLKASLKDNNDFKYGEPLRMLYVFDGKEYFTVSKFTVESKVLDNIDSTIRQSSLW